MSQFIRGGGFRTGQMEENMSYKNRNVICIGDWWRVGYEWIGVTREVCLFVPVPITGPTFCMPFNGIDVHCTNYTLHSTSIQTHLALRQIDYTTLYSQSSHSCCTFSFRVTQKQQIMNCIFHAACFHLLMSWLRTSSINLSPSPPPTRFITSICSRTINKLKGDSVSYLQFIIYILVYVRITIKRGKSMLKNA